MMMLTCDVCALDPGSRHWVTCPSVASFPEGFEYEDQRCQTACFVHRSRLDMPPPDDWKPRRNVRTDSFMMDFENEILGDFDGYVPTGRNRHWDVHWETLVRSRVDPYHPDVTWREYVDWITNGGGDEWFQGSPQANPQPSLKRKLTATTLELERDAA
jgi:hypothetical protein